MPVRLLLLLLMAALVAGCGGDDDDGAAVTVTGPAVTVSAERLTGSPDAYERRDVVVTGTVTRRVPAPPERQAFLLGDVLVVATTADGVSAGDRVTVTGNARRVDPDRIEELAGITGGDTRALEAFGGRMAVFATEVTSSG